MGSKLGGMAGRLVRIGAALAFCLGALLAVPANASERLPAATSQKREAAPRFFSIRQVLESQRLVPDAGPDGWTLRLSVIEDAASLADLAPALPFAARGYSLFQSSNRQIEAEWQRVQAEWSRERAALERCAARPQSCSPAEAAAQSILNAARLVPIEERLALVHRRVNAAVTYRTDPAQHGLADRWSSPLSTLSRAGDCEDYAIAKYFLLREAGIDEAQLGLVLVRDQKAGEDHAVLGVRGMGGWLLYDNRYDLPDSDTETAHYRPVMLVASDRIAMFASAFAAVRGPREEAHDLRGNMAIIEELPPMTLRGALD